MTIETTVIARWLYTKLAADSSLTAIVGTRIYEQPAPQEAVYPLVVFQLQTTDDVSAVGGIRVMTTAEYLVRVIGQSANVTSSLLTAAERIDAVLHRASGSVTGGAVIGAVRLRPFVLAETDGPVQYRHLGGIYRLWAQ